MPRRGWSRTTLPALVAVSVALALTGCGGGGGGISTDFASIASWFAKRRAAPGDVAVVRRGCRAGLHV